MTKLLLPLFVISLISACGGGSESDSSADISSNSKTTNIANSYVTGEFKKSIDTEFYAPSHDAVYGNNGYDCSINNDTYFESENVLVFGGAEYQESDYRYAATLVENNLDKALDKMGVTKKEFDDARPIYTSRAASNVIDFMSEAWEIEINGDWFENDITNLTLITPFDAPDDWSELVYWDRYKHVKAYWNKIGAAEQYLFAKEFKSIYQQLYPNNTFNPMGQGYLRIPKKIMVCITDRMGSSIYGEGTILGMNIPPKSHATRKYGDEDQVILHELIHTIQQNLAAPVETVGRVMDHWFVEGQATFLAGQTTAKSTDNQNPVDVVTWSNESNVFNDTNEAYKHYALAYSYLDSTSNSEMKSMLLDIRYFTEHGDPVPENFISGAAFESAFDKNMKKKGGQSLTLKQFRSDYHSLLAQ